MKKRLILLGATGSIGVTTLDVVRDFSEHFEVVALSTHRNAELLLRQAAEFAPRAICVTDPEAAARAAGMLNGSGMRLLVGEAGLIDLVREYDADMLVVATVGFAGLFPTIAGIERGMTIALANKEVLVVGGEVVMAQARRCGVSILPIDSEHNAILQCLAGNDRRAVRRLILTASGGPFREYSAQRMESVTREEALRHPTWNMGPKITIDCSTLMNKGFEMIEACHLFDMRPEQVEVVVHPQSTIHSMVEFSDGSILAQLGQTNMYLPILNVLFHPERRANKFDALDLSAVGRLDFARPDRRRFPCLDYAYEACASGGTMPAALNGANEVAVGAFLAGRLPYAGIAAVVRHVMDQHQSQARPDLESLRETDRWAREMAGHHAGTAS